MFALFVLDYLVVLDASSCVALVCFCSGFTSPEAVKDLFCKISPKPMGVYARVTVCSCHTLPSTCSAPRTSFSGNRRGRPSTVIPLYLEICFCQTWAGNCLGTFSAVGVVPMLAPGLAAAGVPGIVGAGSGVADSDNIVFFFQSKQMYCRMGPPR